MGNLIASQLRKMGLLKGIDGEVAMVTKDVTGRIRVSSGSSGNLLEKPREANAGGVICDWQATNGVLSITSGTGTAVLDAATVIDGAPALKLNFAAAAETYIAQFVLTNPISLANFKTLQVPIKITSNDSTSGVASAASPIQVWIYTNSGKSIRLQCDADCVPPNGIQTFSFSRDAAAGLVTFGGGATWATLDTDTVTKFTVVQATIAGSVAFPCWVGQIRADAVAVGCVSIVMDGEYSSQYDLIKPIFDKYGIKCSLAITNADIGQAGRMTLSQIGEYYAGGSECIHHTFDSTKSNGYVNATDWPSSAVICADIKAQWAFFRKNNWLRGIGKAVAAFAENFTPTVLTARQKLIADAFKAAGVEAYRKSVGQYVIQMSIGSAGVKPFMCRGSMQVSNGDSFATIQPVIDRAEANGEWAIFTLHRAVADSATPGSLEIRVGQIELFASYLASRVANGNLVVKPFGEAYDWAFK